MLKKLFKYDFKSIFQIWWILSASVVGISFIASFVFRALAQGNYDDEGFTFTILVILAVLLGFVAIISLAALPTITLLLVYWRFYRNFYTDEGYLTFTLPVPRSLLFFEKTLHSVVWTILSALVMIICIFIYAVIVPPTNDGSLFYFAIFKGIGDLISVIWSGIGAWFLLYVLEGLLILLEIIVFSTSLIHFCITCGAIIAKKLKLLAGIGIYYAVNMGVSLLTEIVIFISTAFMMPGLSIYLDRLADTQSLYGLIALVLLLAIGVIGSGAGIMYLLTLRCVEQKLNLP